MAFFYISISSYILWFFFTYGSGLAGDEHCPNRLTGLGSTGNSTFVFGLTRYAWVDIHSWISIVIVCLILIHLLLHWQWIVETIKRVKSYFLKRQKAILERYIAVSTLFILTAFEALSGCILWLIIPRGVGNRIATQYDMGRTFWGLQRNVWVDLHAWVAVFMVVIIVVHIVIHWRWIINMTLGKIKAKKAMVTINPAEIQKVDNTKSGSTLDQTSYLSRVGMLIGLVGAICFGVAMLTFQLDWVGKYGFMLFLIPVPFISIMFARKWSFIGGTLLIILGIATVLLYLIFPIGIVWNKVGVWNELGLETIYTVVFVTLPLVISGILFIISKRLKKRGINESIK
jgi:hypothetical protein